VIHPTLPKELKELDIGAARVDMIVWSTAVRKTPAYENAHVVSRYFDICMWGCLLGPRE
jgi:hypothetical protein